MYRGLDTSDVPALGWTEYSDRPYDDVIISIHIYVGTFANVREYAYLNINWTGYLCDDIELPPGMNPDNLVEDIMSDAIFAWGTPDHYVERVHLHLPPSVGSAIEILQHIEGALETDFGQMAAFLDCCGGKIERRS